jgi:hypothetical protein
MTSDELLRDSRELDVITCLSSSQRPRYQHAVPEPLVFERRRGVHAVPTGGFESSDGRCARDLRGTDWNSSGSSRSANSRMTSSRLSCTGPIGS